MRDMRRPFLLPGLLLLCSLFFLGGCADPVPVEPAANTGTVFQRPIEDLQNATRNGLTRLNFAILKEDGEYFEAVHLKPGETAEDNKGELVGVWLKPRKDSVLVLINTRKRASGIKNQRVWDQDLLREIMKELR